MLIGFLGTNRYLPLYSPDDGGGSGGSGGTSGSGGTANNGGEADDQQEEDEEESEEEDEDDEDAETRSAEASFSKLLRRYGGNVREAAMELFRDNWKQRQRVRLLKDENKQLQTAARPGKGRAVVPAKDAVELAEYRKLGLKPAEVRQAVEERRTLAERLSTTERETRLREVVDATGWNLAPLKRVIGNLDVETVEEDDGKGAKAPVSYVLTTKQVGGKDTVERTKITDYADREWSDMIPALTAQSNGGKTNGATTNQSTGNQQNGGRRLVRQGVGGSAQQQQGQQRKPGQLSSDYTQRTYVVPGAKRDEANK